MNEYFVKVQEWQAQFINRGYYMAARGYEFHSLVRFAHKIRIPKRQCNVLFII